MKIKLLLFAFILSVSGIKAQSSIDKWTALNDFHGVMSATFHPAEEGNLEPIKSRSEELVTKAAALLKSDIPASFRTKAILDSAEKLQLKAKSIHQLVVTKATDAEITKALSDAHEIFHEIIGMCSGEK